MQLCCPGCGLLGSLESFIADKDARHVASLMGRVPPVLSSALLAYIGLFAPAKRVVPFAKTRRLLDELVPMIEAGRITRSRREWPVSLAQWEDGFRHMAERRAQLTLPLKTHGYLLEVLAGAANQVEAKAEGQGIERISQGERGSVQAEPVAAGAVATSADGLLMRRCVHELKQVLAANKRTNFTASPDALRKHLAGMGFGAAAIDHALSTTKEITPHAP